MVDDVQFIEPAEEDEVFRAGLQSLIDSTKSLGPIIHLCILSQTIGRITAFNHLDKKEGVKITMNMNFEVGVQQALADMMEASLNKGEPN